MANRHRGEYALMLGGKEYTLRPSFEALEGACTDTGLGLPILAGMFKSPHWRPSYLLAMIRRTMQAGGETAPADLAALLASGAMLNAADVVEEMLQFALVDAAPGNSEAPSEKAATPGPAASLGADLQG